MDDRGRSVASAAQGRIARAAFTLALVFVLAFALLRLAPGDPAERLDDPAIPAEQAARTRRALGLDRPWPVQLATTALSYAHGELGVSFVHHRPVAEVIRAALPPTLALGAVALALAYGGGVCAALALARTGRRWRARAEQAALVLALVPRFWLGTLLVLVLHDRVHWLPASHAAPAGESSGGWQAAHLVLPALTLALPAAAAIARWQLLALAAAAESAHARFGRALGLRGVRFRWQAIVRPSLAPVLALLGTDLVVLASGAVLVETMFAWPGLGTVAANAVLAADYPLGLAAVLLASVLVIVGREVATTVAAWADPRAGAAR